MKGLVIIIALLGATAAVASRYTDFGRTAQAGQVDESAIFETRVGDLTISVVENGYLKAKNSESIKPKFRRSGTITWLVEEGSKVEKDDILVEFEKTELQNDIDEHENRLIQYEAELEAAKANRKIQERDNEATIEKAEIKVELAELALERHKDGDAPNEVRKLELAVEKAESAYERAKESFKQVPDLVAEGFMTKIDEEEERINLREAQINVENAKADLELHNTYTTKISLTEKTTALKDAERELANAREKASINLTEKEARVTQAQRQVDTTKQKLVELKKELDDMTVKAPQPGIVHYGDPSRWWDRDRIKVGETVHRGNTLITLPDLSEMQVQLEVHEADIDLVKVGMEVVVTVETHNDKVFSGRVSEVASVASSNGWNSDANNKTFKVIVDLDPFEAELRSGVTAKAEVKVETLDDVVQVPNHAIVAEGGEHFCFVYENGEVAQRPVTIGKNNSHYVQIVEGLSKGEKVLLYDPRERSGVPGADDSGGEEEGGVTSDLAGMNGSA